MEAAAGGGGGGAPGGLPRFACPPDFCASRFAPGPPFSLDVLQDPSKELLLIRAPANFNPESFDGQVLPLLGTQTLKVPQPDEPQKVYSIQVTPGPQGTCARLLVPSVHKDHLTCAPPFAGSLIIWERFGDSGTKPLLFPMADKLAPQIPEGLKQRFMPFGGQPKRPLPREAAEKPLLRKKKKRQLHTVGYLGEAEGPGDVADGVPEALPEEFAAAAEGSPEGGRKKKLKKWLAAEADGETPSVPDSQPGSSPLLFTQDSLFSSEVLSPKSKKKKKKKLKEELVERGDLPEESDSLTQQSEYDPGLHSEALVVGETSSTGAEELVGHKQKKKKKKKKKHSEEEALVSMDPVFIKEEPMEELWEGSGLGGLVGGGSPGLAAEETETSHLGHKSKKKKKKEKMEEMEQASLKQEMGTMLLESVKEELQDLDELAASSGEGILQWEAPSHKHKKKKKKEHKREVE